MRYCLRVAINIIHMSSAVAEMGDRSHNRHGPKEGRLLCPFRGGAGFPSNTMWPGPRSTSVRSGVFIHPCSRLVTIDMSQKLGGGCAFFSGTAGSPSNTKSPGPRTSFIPSGILVQHYSRLATTDIGRKLGVCAPLGDGKLGPHLTQCRLC